MSKPFPHAFPTVTYVPVSGTGTTLVKAAVAGQRHYVISGFGTLDANGRIGFSGSVSGTLVPGMSITATGGWVLPSSGGVLFQTAQNEALNIVTDQPFNGCIGVFTGP